MDSYKFFLLYIKIGWRNKRFFIKKNSQTHRDVILKRTKVYYENDKKRLAEETKNKYKELPEEKI